MKNMSEFSIIVDTNDNQKKRKLSKTKNTNIPTINNIAIFKIFERNTHLRSHRK